MHWVWNLKFKSADQKIADYILEIVVHIKSEKSKKKLFYQTILSKNISCDFYEIIVWLQTWYAYDVNIYAKTEFPSFINNFKTEMVEILKTTIFFIGIWILQNYLIKFKYVLSLPFGFSIATESLFSEQNSPLIKIFFSHLNSF